MELFYFFGTDKDKVFMIHTQHYKVKLKEYFSVLIKINPVNHPSVFALNIIGL